MNRGASPQNELSLNMKLISQNELDGFGGIGEGMGMHKTKDGRRIMWLGHEGPPKNFTGVDVTDPKKPKVVVQTDLPHSKMRSNSIEVVGDLMIVSHQIRGVEPPYKPAGFTIWDISKPETPKKITHFDCSGPKSLGVNFFPRQDSKSFRSDDFSCEENVYRFPTLNISPSSRSSS